jgi:3-methyladenine DNA glycosylase Tag
MNYVNIDTKNKTKIVATKQIVENLRTNEAIRNYIISSVSEIFKDKEILKKQKVVAIKNLAKDLKIALKNEAFNYSLNLVIRNLNEYHNLQKSETKDENGKVKPGLCNRKSA